jgi:hypothetical protein
MVKMSRSPKIYKSTSESKYWRDMLRVGTPQRPAGLWPRSKLRSRQPFGSSVRVEAVSDRIKIALTHQSNPGSSPSSLVPGSHVVAGAAEQIAQLIEDVLTRIFAFVDLYTVRNLCRVLLPSPFKVRHRSNEHFIDHEVNKAFLAVASTKRFWISILRKLCSRLLLDSTVDYLEALSTSELQEIVRRAVLEPRTWTPQSVIPPIAPDLRKAVVSFDGKDDPLCLTSARCKRAEDTLLATSGNWHSQFTVLGCSYDAACVGMGAAGPRAMVPAFESCAGGYSLRNNRLGYSVFSFHVMYIPK